MISKKASNVPVITDSTGKVDTDFNFEFGENTSVYYSCSIKYKNEFFIFGGNYGDERRQISKISGCQLEQIGALDFDHYYGTCTDVNDMRILLDKIKEIFPLKISIAQVVAEISYLI